MKRNTGLRLRVWFTFTPWFVAVVENIEYDNARFQVSEVGFVSVLKTDVIDNTFFSTLI